MPTVKLSRHVLKHKQMYKEIADRYYSAVEHSKRVYYHEKVSDCNQKQLFKFIDGLFKAKSSSPLLAHVSPFELAQRFSEYFSSKIVALHSDIDNITSQPVGYVITEEEPLYRAVLMSLLLFHLTVL